MHVMLSSESTTRKERGEGYVVVVVVVVVVDEESTLEAEELPRRFLGKVPTLIKVNKVNKVL